jgi:hypothetical protein
VNVCLALLEIESSNEAFDLANAFGPYGRPVSSFLRPDYEIILDLIRLTRDSGLNIHLGRRNRCKRQVERYDCQSVSIIGTNSRRL